MSEIKWLGFTFCVVLLVGASGGVGCKKKTPKKSARKLARDYINELARIHLGVVKNLNRYNADKRTFANNPDQLKQARARLKQNAASLGRQFYTVSVPFETARAYHRAYGEFLHTWIVFIQSFLVLDAAKAGGAPAGSPSVKELDRRTAKAAKAWEATLDLMTSERSKFASKYKLTIEKGIGVHENDPRYK